MAIYGAVAGKRVLVVDDDPDIRELLFTALEDEGFEVVPAGNGQEALAIIKTFRSCCSPRRAISKRTQRRLRPLTSSRSPST